MCIMEVRPGQHDSTIQQACTHNLGTVVSDLELFSQLLDARNAPPELRANVLAFHDTLNDLYDQACDLYGSFLAQEFAEGHIHTHDTHLTAGQERTIVDIARAAAEADRIRARKFETR